MNETPTPPAARPIDRTPSDPPIPAEEKEGEVVPSPDPGASTVVANPRSSPTASTLALQSIGGYVVVKKIGEGAMGAVYLVEDEKLGRRVAVKTMRPELASRPADRERFLREARAAAAVESDHIVPILHVGQAADGTPFIAMPVLQGESLESRLRREPVAPQNSSCGWPETWRRDWPRRTRAA